MRSLTLAELPKPSTNKTGWPWTEESIQLPAIQPNGAEWPKISIVTPSYNQGQFLEETIRSVLLQGYPNLEYIIIDGGSADHSLEIIKKYEPWLTYWVSERDRGQANAINKGLKQARGAIAAYLNSDDFYLPGALEHVGKTFFSYNVDILVGKRQPYKAKFFFCRRQWWREYLQPFVYPFIFDLNTPYQLPQECIFWNHSKYSSLTFDENYHFCLDVWWFVQIFSGANIIHSTRQLGHFRIHPMSKSSRLQELAQTEIKQIRSKVSPYLGNVPEETKQFIVREYERVSKYTFMIRFLRPFKDYLFGYYHPPYFPINFLT